MKKFSRKVRKAVRVLCSRGLVLLKKENEKLSYENEKLVMELEECKDTISSMTKDKYILQEQIEFLEERVKELTNSKKQIENEKDKYFVALDVKTNECMKLKENLLNTIEESERRQDLVVELTQKLEKAQKQLDELSKPWYKRWLK